MCAGAREEHPEAAQHVDLGGIDLHLARPEREERALAEQERAVGNAVDDARLVDELLRLLQRLAPETVEFRHLQLVDAAHPAAGQQVERIGHLLPDVGSVVVDGGAEEEVPGPDLASHPPERILLGVPRGRLRSAPALRLRRPEDAHGDRLRLVRAPPVGHPGRLDGGAALVLRRQRDVGDDPPVDALRAVRELDGGLLRLRAPDEIEVLEVGKLHVRSLRPGSDGDQNLQIERAVHRHLVGVGGGVDLDVVRGPRSSRNESDEQECGVTNPSRHRSAAPGSSA